MDNKIAQHVKTQLQTLRQSDSLDYSKGMIDALLAYLDAVCPETITIQVLGSKNNSIIESIKAIRQTFGYGLAESKQLYESKGLCYEGTDLKTALKVYNGLKDTTLLKVTGMPKTVGLLFEKE